MHQEDNKDYKAEPVPYIVFESAMAREERKLNNALSREEKKQKNLVVALIVTVVVILLCNAAWLMAWTSYDYVSEEHTVESTGSGHANYVGANASGVFYNGESGSEETQPD